MVAKAFSQIGWNGVFTGTFNGNSYTKYLNLNIDEPDWANVGLFGSTQGANIYNFTLTGGSVTGAGDVGSAVGYSYDTTVSGVINNNSVSGSGNVGGVVGYEYIDNTAGETLNGLANNGSVYAI